MNNEITYTQSELFERFKYQIDMLKKWVREDTLIWRNASDKYLAELFVRDLFYDDEEFYDYFYEEMKDLLELKELEQKQSQELQDVLLFEMLCESCMEKELYKTSSGRYVPIIDNRCKPAYEDVCIHLAGKGYLRKIDSRNYEILRL